MAGKANRKHGRSKRKPTDQRYKNEMRWERNKKRAITRDAVWKSACKAVRSAAKEGEVVKDVSRRVRKLRAAA